MTKSSDKANGHSDKSQASGSSEKPDKPADPDQAKQPAATSPAEDVKRKFREALDRKHAHGGRDVSEDGDQAKIHDAHGPAKAQQMFRRKSGG